MQIILKKLTDKSILDRACSITSGKEVATKSLYKFYKSEHSPIRTQLFWIEMLEIPEFVSTHFVRHSVGVTHFVEAYKNDIPYDRNRLVNHAMIINAQALINISRFRLCKKANHKTREVVLAIKEAIRNEDYDLYRNLKANCEYRGECPEIKPCR